MKFANVMTKDADARVLVKLKVVNACVNSSLTYSCETWGNYPLSKVEVQQRKSLKIALDVKSSVPNEIIYIESNSFPLECKIKSRQLKFWKFLEDYMTSHPGSAVAKITQLGKDLNIPYLRHYISLENTYVTPKECKKQLQNCFKTKWEDKIRNASIADHESRLGVYFQINPQLKSWVPNPQSIHEIERKIVTRYRTGSHSLNIELGRFSNTPRDNRLCKCREGVQTIWHIFSECPLTTGKLDIDFENLNDIFANDNVHIHLIKLTKNLKIPLGRM